MTLKKFTIIGNCQSDTLSKFLLSNPYFSQIYQYIQTPYIHDMNEDQLNFLYSETLPLLDLIIIQPISENYKNNYRYSTKSILSHVNDRCIKILFPSLYFDFYHQFITYISSNGVSLGQPFDYQDVSIIKAYKKGILQGIDKYSLDMLNFVIEEYRNSLYNEYIMDNNYMTNKLNENIHNLIVRENEYNNFVNGNTHIIKSSDFILNNFKKNLLFYSMNHPTKHVFHYIANSILIILNVPLAQFDDNLDPLKGLIMPVYKVVQKYIEFPLDYYYNFRHFDLILTDEDIIQKYINSYNSVDISVFNHIN